ncbi:MAG: hypothetical protein ACTSQY_06995 [Candidatus Odinarchaeia archaeon]
MSDVNFDLTPIDKKRSRMKKREKYTSVYQYNNQVDKFYSDYFYETDLTERLDNLSQVKFDQELINEIVLWKVNRYASLNNETLRKLDSLATLKKGQHRLSEDVLDELLDTHGIDLAMASTILRFRNPEVFQIMDRHAYRAIYGEKYPLYGSTPNIRKIELYFDYIDKLIELAKDRNLDYKILDRLLYEFDKQLNGKL